MSQYLKALVSLIGPLVTALGTVYGNLPWWPVIATVAASLLVYLVPNTPVPPAILTPAGLSLRQQHLQNGTLMPEYPPVTVPDDTADIPVQTVTDPAAGPALMGIAPATVNPAVPPTQPVPVVTGQPAGQPVEVPDPKTAEAFMADFLKLLDKYRPDL